MDLIANAFCADVTSTLEVQSPDFLLVVTELVHFLENRPPNTEVETTIHSSLFQP